MTGDQTPVPDSLGVSDLLPEYRQAAEQHGVVCEPCPDCTRPSYIVNDDHYSDWGFEDEHFVIEHTCPDRMEVVAQCGTVHLDWDNATIRLDVDDEHGRARLTADDARDLIGALQYLVDEVTVDGAQAAPTAAEALGEQIQVALDEVAAVPAPTVDQLEAVEAGLRAFPNEAEATDVAEPCAEPTAVAERHVSNAFAAIARVTPAEAPGSARNLSPAEMRPRLQAYRQALGLDVPETAATATRQFPTAPAAADRPVTSARPAAPAPVAQPAPTLGLRGQR